ncbi:MAG: CBS domain-containing protein [Methanoregula sp.]|nr:CBS domain-containing protein [Methanoregula sp.]
MTGSESEEPQKKTIGLLMKRCPLSILPDLPLSEIIQRFSEANNFPLMVIEPDGTYAGVITPMDILAAISPAAGIRHAPSISGLDRLMKSTARTARDLMTEGEGSLFEDAEVSDAIRLMERTHSTLIIVLNNEQKPVGCITLSDIIGGLVHPKGH